jgi:hypothetical protein
MAAYDCNIGILRSHQVLKYRNSLDVKNPISRICNIPNLIYPRFLLFAVRGTYNWHFEQEPFVDAMFHYYGPTEGTDGDEGYADLASLNQYFNLKGPEVLVSIEKYPPENISPTELEKWLQDPWKLRVFEDEILGECGSGAQNCSLTRQNGQTAPRRRKRSASTGKWSFLLYEKVSIL